MPKQKKATSADLEKQLADLTEALKRERADTINIRSRHEKQLADLRDLVKADVVQELLPVIDNFERALSHVPKNLENDQYVKGVQVVVKQFEKTLEDIGVKKIQTVGDTFDPHLHEAVSGEGEKIIEELQPGYILGEQVLRHSKVKVG